MATRPRANKNPYQPHDKFLIAEQPGMAVLLTGICLSLFLGLVTRAFIAPTRVRGLIEKAAQNINKNIEVHFQNAEVSLSDGILPRFAVVISNVRMESTQACWMSPVLEIDQMRLPVSIWGLLSGRGAVRDIEADTVKLTLRGEYKNCSERQWSATPPPAAGEPPKLVSLQQEPASRATQGDQIRDVSIGKLQIEADKYPLYHAEFQDVDFRVKAAHPRWIVLDAKTHLFRDEQVGDYLAHANIHVEYKESPEANLEAHFFGNWREGHYSLVGNYSFADHNLIMETEIKHIPFSQIVAMLQKYRLADPSLNARQLWLSCHSRFSGDPAKIASSPFEVTDLLLDGDQIEIDADRIAIKSLRPLQYDPIRLDVRKLNVDKVLSFFNRGLSTKIFAHMGVFSGQAEIRSGRDIRLRGDYGGLEFIFANRGQRELQTISRMRTEAEYLDERWQIHLSDIEPLQGRFDGDIRVSADKSFGDMEAQLKIKSAVLAPHVQKLMTQGGEIGAVSTNLNMQMRAGHFTGFKGQMKVDRLDVAGVKLGASTTRFDFIQGQLQMNVQVESMELAPGSPAMMVVAPVFATSAAGGDLRLGAMKGQFLTQEFRTLHWKNFGARLENTGAKVQTEGAWDEAGQLSGRVSIKNKKAPAQEWRIGGTRADPVFTPEAGRRR